MKITTPLEWEDFRSRLDQWDWVRFPQRIMLKALRDDPVQDCKAVFFIWAEYVAKEANKKAVSYDVRVDKGDIHDMWCNRFLGWTEGKTVLDDKIAPHPITLTSPEDLDKDQLIELLSEIDEWARDNGIFLPRKKDSEYEKWMEAQ